MESLVLFLTLLLAQTNLAVIFYHTETQTGLELIKSLERVIPNQCLFNVSDPENEPLLAAANQLESFAVLDLTADHAAVSGPVENFLRPRDDAYNLYKLHSDCSNWTRSLADARLHSLGGHPYRMIIDICQKNQDTFLLALASRTYEFVLNNNTIDECNRPIGFKLVSDPSGKDLKRFLKWLMVIHKTTYCSLKCHTSSIRHEENMLVNKCKTCLECLPGDPSGVYAKCADDSHVTAKKIAIANKLLWFLPDNDLVSLAALALAFVYIFYQDRDKIGKTIHLLVALVALFFIYIISVLFQYKLLEAVDIYCDLRVLAVQLYVAAMLTDLLEQPQEAGSSGILSLLKFIMVVSHYSLANSLAMFQIFGPHLPSTNDDVCFEYEAQLPYVQIYYGIVLLLCNRAILYHGKKPTFAKVTLLLCRLGLLIHHFGAMIAMPASSTRPLHGEFVTVASLFTSFLARWCEQQSP